MACLVHALFLKATPIDVENPSKARSTHRLILTWAGRLSFINFTMTPKAKRGSTLTSERGKTPNQTPLKNGFHVIGNIIWFKIMWFETVKSYGLKRWFECV